MEIIIIIVFILGYLGITLEHNLKLDKLIPALIMMSICWAIVALGVDSFSNWFDSSKHGLVEGFSSMLHADKMHLVEETLLHHLGKTAFEIALKQLNYVKKLYGNHYRPCIYTGIFRNNFRT